MGIIFYLRKEPINFTPIIRKVKSKSHFFPSQNPNFDFSLQQIWFFLLRTQSQNRIFLLKFRLFTPRNLFFSAFTLKNRKVKSKPYFSSAQNPKISIFHSKILFFSTQNPNSTFHSRSQVKIGFFFFSKPKCRFFTPRYFWFLWHFGNSVVFLDFCGFFWLVWYLMAHMVFFDFCGIFWL